MAKKSISYNENDTVGIRIHEVDRTNTDPKLLPCKVQTVEKKTTEYGSEIVYKLFTNKGKLKNTFKQADLIDLRNVQFDALLDVDIESLEDISVIQASRQVTNWAKGASVCTCRGKCNTAKCKCKRSAVPCSKKFHPKSTRSCLNKDNHSGSAVSRLSQLRSILQQCSPKPNPYRSTSRITPHSTSVSGPDLIKVTPAVSLFDQDIEIKVQGLAGKDKVTVQAWVQHTWRRKAVVFASYGHFVASDNGEVDLKTDASLSGTFTGVDPMGLLWSLSPLPGHPTDARFVWRDVTQPCHLHIALFPNHIVPSESTVSLEDSNPKPLCVTTVSRWMKATDVHRVEINEGRLRGTLFLPPGQGPFPGVIDMFGSAGGLMEARGALLASRGFITLSLAFFRYKDLPQTLHEIQLDYFEEAAEWFSSQPAVQAGGIGVVAVSFGATFAMLMALQCPQVKALVHINGPPFLVENDMHRKGEVFFKAAHLDRSLAAATAGGLTARNSMVYTPEHMIPMWRSAAHMLCLVCDDDGLVHPGWMEELHAHYPPHRAHLMELVHFPLAGHLLEPPYTPHCRASFHPGEGQTVLWGGRAKQHGQAQKHAWDKMLNFLKDKLNA